MSFVFGAVLITSGVLLIGLAYHNHIGDAWKVIVA